MSPAAADTPIQDAPLPPDIPLKAPLGWAVVPDEGWELLDEPDTVRRCRFGRSSCKAPSIARLNRGRYRRVSRDPIDLTVIDSWWHYCGDHLFGRWILGGRIVSWRVVRPEPS